MGKTRAEKIQDMMPKSVDELLDKSGPGALYEIAQQGNMGRLLQMAKMIRANVIQNDIKKLVDFVEKHPQDDVVKQQLHLLRAELSTLV